MRTKHFYNRPPLIKGAGNERALWAIKRIEGSVSKGAWRAIEKTCDYCEQRRGTALAVEGFMPYKHNPKLTYNAKTLRKNMTKEERHLWYDFLKTYPVRFLRQKVIDYFIVDFYCAKAKLVIELDGSQHYEEEGLFRNIIRTERIEAYDITVIRIPNNEISHNFKGICAYIDDFVKNPPGGLSPPSPL